MKELLRELSPEFHTELFCIQVNNIEVPTALSSYYLLGTFYPKIHVASVQYSFCCCFLSSHDFQGQIPQFLPILFLLTLTLTAVLCLGMCMRCYYLQAFRWTNSHNVIEISMDSQINVLLFFVYYSTPSFRLKASQYVHHNCTWDFHSIVWILPNLTST